MPRGATPTTDAKGEGAQRGEQEATDAADATDATDATGATTGYWLQLTRPTRAKRERGSFSLPNVCTNLKNDSNPFS